MTPQETQAALEAIIYAADEPATLDQLSKALGLEKVEVRTALDFLVASCSTDDRGIEIRKVAGGWKFYTKVQHHDVVRRFIKSLQPPIRLTMPALETLAVIAYKQPATVPEINEIRGVNCGGVIKTLLEKHLITTVGRKDVIGRPILYRTSKQFLMRFGLSDLEELPSLKEFEQLAQAALGDDAGIAPTDPESGQGSAPGSEFERGAESSAEGATAGDESSAAAPESPEDESADASGELAAAAEMADSPAGSAAEVFADQARPAESTAAEEADNVRAAAAGDRSSERGA